MPNLFDPQSDLQVFILAGGLGTRSQDPSTPKILQDICGETLLSRHISQLHEQQISKVAILTGYLSEDVELEVRKVNLKYPEMRIFVIPDSGQNGTAGALIEAAKKIKFDNALVILGDILIGSNYNFHFKRWQLSNLGAATLLHPNLHPFDSDLIETDSREKAIRIWHKPGASFEPNSLVRAIAGVHFMTKELMIGSELHDGDIGRDLLAQFVESGDLLGLNTSDYFRDTGTPERLENARQDVLTGSYLRRSAKLKKAIFLDRDGTLIPNIGTARKDCTYSELSQDIAHSISMANNSGIPVFVVTNQPGIAKGEIDFRDVIKIQSQIETYLSQNNAIIDDFRFCPHHPELGHSGEVAELKHICDCRKPMIGMFEDIAQRHSIDLKGSFFFGDSAIDELAAIRAGLEFTRVQNDTFVQTLSSFLSLAISRIKNDYH